MNSVQKIIAIASLSAAAQAMPAHAEPHPISEIIAKQGLAGAEAHLASLTDPDATQQFALGSVRFLRGVENAVQTMWRHRIVADASSLPLLRLPVPENRAAEPFRPELIADMFKQATQDMIKAEAVLAAINDDAKVALEISFDDLWFDVNGNGQRDPEIENFTSMFAGVRLQDDPNAPLPVVTFDTADAAWLAAYANLISTSAELVLAFDPTEPITRVHAAEDRITALSKGASSSEFAEWRPMMNYFAIVIQSIEQDPDREALARAENHLRAMLAQNKVFWTRVALETDDHNEWVPSDKQTSALGLRFPAGTSAAWLAVLSDIEKVLDGDLLLPHPILGEGIGLNVALYLDNPAPIDISSWLHGHGAVAYLQAGPTLSDESWNAFDRLVGRGNGLLMAVMLN